MYISCAISARNSMIFQMESNIFSTLNLSFVVYKYFGNKYSTVAFVNFTRPILVIRKNPYTIKN